MINILCTSKPCDGLLYYSYEHCSYLNEIGVEATLIVIPYPSFSSSDYITSINDKFIHCKDVIFDDYFPEEGDSVLIMGRSMLTLAYRNRREYTQDQLLTLQFLFTNKLLSVYSENHPFLYYEALKHFNPKEVVDLCDFEIYPNGVGTKFIKSIYFKIHKPPVEDVQFKYLFLGTNESYYNTIQKQIHDYESHGIITYEQDYLDPNLNNIQAPIKNLLGIFDIYIYTKDTFDPAPRIAQECIQLGKQVIYKANKDFIDGEEVYRNRGSIDISETVGPILKAI